MFNASFSSLLLKSNHKKLEGRKGYWKYITSKTNKVLIQLRWVSISKTTMTKFCYILILFLMVFAAPPELRASNVPTSGQTATYLNGDDGDLEKGVSWPSPRFTDNNNGTITDNLTNLIWLKNADCYEDITWNNALTKALTLSNGDCSLRDGSSAADWRIPNSRELESLIHAGVTSPAIPDTEGSDRATTGNPFFSIVFDDYWTSTTNPAIPSNALAVNMRWGHIISKPKGGSIYAMFVRDGDSSSPVAQVYTTGQKICYSNDGTVVVCSGTGQDGDVRKGMIWPVPRFTDNGDGTVLDNLTELTWLKDANCLGVSNGWAGAITFANELVSGSCGLSDSSITGDWRLPNRRELLSLIDYSVYSPALSNTAGTGQWESDDPFNDVQPSSGYWSSTTYKGATSQAWFINFTSGITGTDGKIKLAYVWPVRNDLASRLTITTSGDGSGTITSSPAGIECPGTCSAEFGRNDVITLTAQAGKDSRFEGWSISSCKKNRTCQVTMSAPQSVTATFVENSATVASWMILLTK